MREPGDGHPVERLGGVDGVPAGHGAARLPRDVGPAAQDVTEEVEGQLVARPADEVDGEEGLAAHRPDVGEGVGGRDPAPVVGVVDDRGEEVDGADDGAVPVEPDDGGVVAGVGPDEEVGVAGEVDPGEEGLEVGGGQLAGAPTAPGVRRHPDHAVTSRSSLR